MLIFSYELDMIRTYLSATALKNLEKPETCVYQVLRKQIMRLLELSEPLARDPFSWRA
jgi:hypothetical protein